MTGKIIRPPKIYIDTNHLINISSLRQGRNLPPGQSVEAYSFVDKCIAQHFGIIFNPFASLEWVEGKATEESAKEIASVIDSAKLKYQFEQDTFVYTREVLDACKTQEPGIRVPQFDIMHLLSDGGSYEAAYGILASQVPDYFEEQDLPDSIKDAKSVPIEIPIASAKEWVKETFLWKERNPERYRGRVERFKAALWEDIERADEYFRCPERYQIEWMKRHLKLDKILTCLNPGCDIDSLLDRISTDQCPAVKLYWNVREKRMRAKTPPKDNDVYDWLFIPVVPYADLVLTERNLREFILQAYESLKSKVVYNATDAVTIMRNWTS
jgi:hypothetical protein